EAVSSDIGRAVHVGDRAQIVTLWQFLVGRGDLLKIRFAGLRGEKPNGRGDQNAPILIFPDCIDYPGIEVGYGAPVFRVRLVGDKTGIWAGQQIALRSAPKHPDIVRARVIRNVFGAHRVRVVTADTLVSREPDNLFSIDKHSEDVI